MTQPSQPTSRIEKARNGLLKPGLRRSLPFTAVVMVVTACLVAGLFTGVVAVINVTTSFDLPLSIAFIPGVAAALTYPWARD